MCIRDRHKEDVSLRPLIDDLVAKISLKAGKRVEFNTVYHRCETIYADAFCLRAVLGKDVYKRQLL